MAMPAFIVGGEEDLGHEEDSVAEVDADDPHAFDQGLVQHLLGRPAPVEEDRGAFVDLVGQAVVQVVVHLGDELGIAQVGENDVLFGVLPLPEVVAGAFVCHVGTPEERIESDR